MDGKFNTIFLLLIIALTAVTVLPAYAENLSVGGYVKSFAVVYEFPDFRLAQVGVDTPPIGSVSNRLRLTSRWKAMEWVAISAAWDMEPRIQDPALFFADEIPESAVGQTYRFDDFDRRIYPAMDDRTGSFGLYHNLDRLQIDLRLGPFDVIAGRQAIAWGSSRIINPTDVLAPFAFQALDTEDRIGVEAVRIRYPLGFMSEIDAGMVAGKDSEPKHSAAYLRYKTYVLQTDVSALVMAFREHFMVGFDFTRSIGGAGSWLEMAIVWPDRLQPDKDQRGDSYWRLSLGADYSLASNTYGFIEYHFNQPGGSDPADYTDIVFGMPYRDGAVYLLGEHYLIPGVRQQIMPLLNANSEILWNLSDASAFVALTVEYNLAENVYLSGGGFVGLGPGPSSELDLESEFGSYPDIFWFSYRFYF